MPNANFVSTNASLWLIGAGLLLAMLAARELGDQLRRHVARSDSHTGAERDDGYVMSAVMGLLALLIGFTFSLALQRHDARREAVVIEANAIGTAFLRAELLDPAQALPLQRSLRDYTDARIAYGLAATDAGEDAAQKRGLAMQRRLWMQTRDAAMPYRQTQLGSLLVDATNAYIDAEGSRHALRDARIPSRILRIIAIYTLIAAAMIGYRKGEHRAAATVLFVLLTLAATLILDLDQPNTGPIKVSQQPMIDVRASMGPQPSV